MDTTDPKNSLSPLRYMELLNKSLHYMDHWGVLAEFLTEEVQKLTRAGCALLIQYPNPGLPKPHRILGIHPLSYRDWADSAATGGLYENAHRLIGLQCWDTVNFGECSELLGAKGFTFNVVVPLRINSQPFGAMFLLGFSKDVWSAEGANCLETFCRGIAPLLYQAIVLEERTGVLIKTKEQLDATLNALPDLMFEIDREGRFYDYRASSIDKLFVPPQNFLGRKVAEVLPEAAADVILEELALAAQVGHSRGATYALQYPIGLRWFELSMASKGNEPATDNRFVVLARDITDRKNSEEELQCYREHLERLVQERTIALEQKNTQLSADLAMRKRMEEELRHYQERLEELVLERTGELEEKNAQLVSEFVERQRAETELRRLFEQTQHDAQFKTSLLNEVNHRVKNNMMAILGLMLAEEQRSPAEGRPFVAAALHNLSQRIGGLLKVHERLSESKWAPMQLCDLAEMILRYAVQTLPVECRHQIDVQPSELEVTPRQANYLALILHELITNTIKYTPPENGTIQVTFWTWQQEEKIYFEYRDNGPGYPEEVIRRQRGNVGINLMVQLITETLGGTIILANSDGAVAKIGLRIEERGKR